MVAVTTDMVVTATATNFHHFDVVVTLSNVLMREASGNAKERFGCKKRIKHIAVDDMVSVMIYDALHEAVNVRYQQIKESPEAIDIIKSEFGITFSVALEILGLKDELDDGDEQF